MISEAILYFDQEKLRTRESQLLSLQSRSEKNEHTSQEMTASFLWSWFFLWISIDLPCCLWTWKDKRLFCQWVSLWYIKSVKENVTLPQFFCSGHKAIAQKLKDYNLSFSRLPSTDNLLMCNLQIWIKIWNTWLAKYKPSSFVFCSISAFMNKIKIRQMCNREKQ